MLLPQANVTNPVFAVASTVVGATVFGHEIVDIDDNITVILRLEFPVGLNLAYSYYNAFPHNYYTNTHNYGVQCTTHNNAH